MDEEEKGCEYYYYAVIRKVGRVARGVVSTSKELVVSALGASSDGEIRTAGSIPECIQAMGRGPERVHSSCVDILQATDSRSASMHRMRILRESGDLVFDTPAERYAKGEGGEAGSLQTGDGENVWLRIGPVDPETWPTFQLRILRAETCESFRELALHVPEALQPKTMRSRSRIGCAMLATVIGTVCKSAGIRVTRIILGCPETYRALEVQAKRWIRGLDAKTRTPGAEIVVDVRMALDALGIALHLDT